MGNRDIWDELELAGRGEHLEEEMFEFLSAYVDGECSAKERRLVEAYLKESAAASSLLAELRVQAAFVSGELVDSPAWLTQSILAKTVGKRKVRWPFAAGLAAASVAGAIALVSALPHADNDSPLREVLAAKVNDGPVFSGPAPDTSRLAAKEQPVQAPIAEASRSVPDRKPRPTKFTTVSAPAQAEAKSEAAPKETEPVALESTPPAVEPESTYAVVEYGSGRFQPKQPDMIDGSQSPSAGAPAGEQNPTVLPDARERLRDQVRKVNEKKLEIDDKERSGS